MKQKVSSKTASKNESQKTRKPQAVQLSLWGSEMRVANPKAEHEAVQRL